MQVVPLKNKQGKVANNKMKTWLWQIWTERTLYGDSWSFTKRDRVAANVVNWSEAGLSWETGMRKEEKSRDPPLQLWMPGPCDFTRKTLVFGAFRFPFIIVFSLVLNKRAPYTKSGNGDSLPLPMKWHFSLNILSTSLLLQLFLIFSIKKHKTLEEFKMLAWNF